MKSVSTRPTEASKQGVVLRSPSLARHSTKAAALVISLALLVLLLALAMALFLGAGSEVRNASLYKHSQGLQELTESAVNLVQAQIKDATLENATLPPAQRNTWASQPGMIRTYGAGTNAVRSYKLYSWVDPRVSGHANDSIPADWASSPAMFVDLNEPSRDPAAPADPNAMRYPIAYPPITGPTAPAGYSISNTAPLAAVSGFTNPVPMPVQWLYLLQDGAMVYPSTATGATATIPGATSTNPIVGRIAYWADDETSKVNLNTAAGGEFWHKPVQKTQIQYENSRWQPTRWEFQRYPGHPARTDLTKVFPPALFGFDTSPTGMLQTRRKIWELIPRVADNGATRQTVRNNAPTDVPYDMDRLFSSTGEARFAANPPASGNRSDFISDAAWRERIEQAGFLITTSSRAPETTAFGTPRVALWPISSTDSAVSRTALDQLIAFASTIQNTGSRNNPQRYFFTRSTPAATAADVAMNADLLNYITEMTNLPQPGFAAGSLASKYSVAGRDQILTQMYDYIRIVNKLDLQLNPSNLGLARQRSFAGNSQTVPPTTRTVGGRETRGFGRFPTVSQIAMHFICTADAAVPASNVPENRSLWASAAANSFTPLAAGQRNIMALVYFEVAMPTMGFPNAEYPQISFTIQGLDQITLDGQNLRLPPTATLTVLPGDLSQKQNINTGYAGGVLKYLIFLSRVGATLQPRDRNGFSSNANPNYELASHSVRVNGSTMALGGATVNVSVRWPLTAANALHEVAVPFPSRTIPTPTLPTDNLRWVFDQVGWDGGVPVEVSRGRLPNNNLAGWEASQLFLTANDTLVAVATVHGDYRISMVQPGEPSHWGAVPFLSGTNFAHRLYNTSGGNMIPLSNTDSPRVFGLLPTVTPTNPNQGIGSNLRPPVPPRADLAALGLAHPLTYGDFDNGLPNLADGALINAPDEVAGWDEGLYWDNTIDANFGQMSLGAIFHSPNRKIASAIAFGSLPSAAVQGRPWQNLLFRPAPEVTNHPGRAGFNIDGTASSSAPADFQWLDFFWMPVVEPYAISENFSTAGKINMNHRIAPFDYIRRTTGLEAVLGSGGVIGAPSAAAQYTNGLFRKHPGNSFFDDYLSFESAFAVNTAETLIGFDNRLNANSLFRSVGELCALPIVPNAPGATFASLNSGTWWMDYRYTGDNTREATYNDLYPRLTTRSNTYSVHHRVQLLKKVPGTDPAVWDESRDKVLSESRGKTLIERYLDPNAIYPNYATNFTGAESLESFYRFRVLQRSDFSP